MPTSFSNRKYTDMHFVYDLCAIAVDRKYCETFPNNTLHNKTFTSQFIIFVIASQQSIYDLFVVRHSSLAFTCKTHCRSTKRKYARHPVYPLK